MGTSLSGLTPATTFDGLLKVGDNDPLTANLKAISDGSGNDSAIQLSTGELKVIGQATMAGLTNNTSASAILAQNSDGYNLLQVRNDGTTIINNNAYSFSQPRFTSTKEIVIHQGLSVGQTASPTAARLHIKGSGTTSATTSLLVQNSDGTELLNVQDDGIIDSQYLRLNGASPSPLISAEGNAGKAVRLGNEGYFSSFNYLELKTWDGTSYSPVIRVTGNTTQNVGIGETTPTARLHVKGSGNSSATNAFFVENSTGNDLFRVVDNGLIYMSNDNYIFSNSQSQFNNKLGIGTTPDSSTQLHVKGSGNDNTTTSLLVQNSDATELFKIADDGATTINGATTIDVGNGDPFATNGLYLGDEKLKISNYFNQGIINVPTGQLKLMSPEGVGIGTNYANTSFTAMLGVKGKGATSATTALLVQNSAGTELFKVQDNGRVNVALGLKISNLNVIDWDAGISAVRYFYQSGVGNHVFYTNSGTERMKLNNDGDLGIGETTPTARLHVKGSGNDNTTTSLLVQNSDASASLTYDDSGKVEIVGNAQTGFIQTYGFGAVGFGNESGPTIIYGNTGGLFLAGMHTGGGYTAFGANSSSSQRVLIKGSGATSATTSLLVQNSAGTDLLKVTDDGILGLGDTGAQGQINLRRSNDGVVIGTIQGTSNGLYLTNQDGSNHILIGTTSTNGVSVGGGSAPTMGARFGIKGSGNDATTTALLVQNSDGTSMFSIKDSGYIDINPTNSSGGTVQFRGDGTDNLLKVNANDNYVSVGANPPGGTRFFVKGSGTTSATTALLVQNSAGTDLFKVADNGDINIDNGVAADMKVRISPTANKYLEIDRQGRQVRIYSGATGNAGIFMTQADKFSIGVNNAPLLLLDENSNVRIGSGITSADTSAKLQVDSTTKGFLPPRMTSGEKNAIASPAPGLMVYDTDANQMSYWNGGAWINF